MNDTWIQILNGIMKMPGAKVDRNSFLSSTFSYLSGDRVNSIIQQSPIDILSEEEINKAAKSIITRHTMTASSLSAVSGIPGGFALLATIPADLFNYYYHIVTVGQKLGYLYGYPDMLDEDEQLNENGKIVLTTFIGVMNNVTIAQEIIRGLTAKLAKKVTTEVATNFAGKVLSKQVIAHSTEIIAQKLGTQITAKTGGRVITKAIPLLSGVICGAITYKTFKSSAIILHNKLREVSNELAIR